MHHTAVLLSIPGLREQDLSHMPNLSELAQQGGTCRIQPSFPAMTCPVQQSLLTGTKPDAHGVIANGFYWRDKDEVEMWTAWNEVVQQPYIWDKLKDHDAELTSAAWFPMLIKGASADYICTPAPIHNPDGSESLWCYTKPTELYGEMRDQLGHFPLMNFWGPLANESSSQWIADSAVVAANQFHPRFTYIYLTHLDYAAQKFGPDSEQAIHALGVFDKIIAGIIDGFQQAGYDDCLWMIASEYAITPVERVCYPNRLLREAGLLSVTETDDGEILDTKNSTAWALSDHQVAHVFVKEESEISKVAEVLKSDPTIEQVLIGAERGSVSLDHPRSGEIVLVSEPDAWFAYYYWLDDDKAPSFARTVDIHRKPGYDPVEMFINMPSKQTPLDATLVKGSHGYPADHPDRQGVFISSDAAFLTQDLIQDVDVAGLVLKNFGVTP